MKNYLEQIVAELTNHVDQVIEEQGTDFLAKLTAARHIFLAGAGRSGLAIQAFANRLLHLGFSVSLVGEITAPHTQEGDLLIVCSGSGETGSLLGLVKKAKAAQVEVALVTTKPNSTMGQLADVCLVLPGKSKEVTSGNTGSFQQPMGTAFEQLAFLSFDAFVLALMKLRDETNETMAARHADFE